MQETWVWSLGQEDLLEKGMATHSSILAWRISWTEEPGSLQSMGSQRVGHNWATNTHAHTHTHTHTHTHSLTHSHCNLSQHFSLLGQYQTIQKPLESSVLTGYLWDLPTSQNAGLLQVGDSMASETSWGPRNLWGCLELFMRPPWILHASFCSLGTFCTWGIPQSPGLPLAEPSRHLGTFGHS